MRLVFWKVPGISSSGLRGNLHLPDTHPGSEVRAETWILPGSCSDVQRDWPLTRLQSYPGMTVPGFSPSVCSPHVCPPLYAVALGMAPTSNYCRRAGGWSAAISAVAALVRHHALPDGRTQSPARRHPLQRSVRYQSAWLRLGHDGLAVVVWVERYRSSRRRSRCRVGRGSVHRPAGEVGGGDARNAMVGVRRCSALLSVHCGNVTRAARHLDGTAGSRGGCDSRPARSGGNGSLSIRSAETAKCGSPLPTILLRRIALGRGGVDEATHRVDCSRCLAPHCATVGRRTQAAVAGRWAGPAWQPARRDRHCHSLRGVARCLGGVE